MTGFLAMVKNEKKSKKLGRPEELRLEDLPKRYTDMKWFLENYWGRVGPRLRQVNQPEDVRNTLNLVPGIEWHAPFRDHAICLIAPESDEVNDDELRLTRRKYKAAVAEADRLWSEYFKANETAQRVIPALKTAISQFENALQTFPIFLVLSLLARELNVAELTKTSKELETSSRQAMNEKESLKKILSAQEAWFARSQVVEFAKNRRHEKTLLNFARAMAGLPEWGWFHSRKMCATLQDQSRPATPYEIFELLKKIVRPMRPLKLENVEKRLRQELLRPDGDPLLKGYVTPHWYYLQDSIRYCRGVKKSDLPFKIMDRFLYHLERPKNHTEIELARRNELA